MNRTVWSPAFRRSGGLSTCLGPHRQAKAWTTNGSRSQRAFTQPRRLSTRWLRPETARNYRNRPPGNFKFSISNFQFSIPRSCPATVPPSDDRGRPVFRFPLSAFRLLPFPFVVPPSGGGNGPDLLKLLLGLAILALVLTGCQSGSHAPYIAPRVIGRVLDARTSQPVPDVKIRRVTPGQEMDPTVPMHGGQVIQQNPAVYTKADGTFVLESVRDLTLLRRSGWYGVNLSFEHRNYVRRVIEYTLGKSTNTASGEPVVPAGDVLLSPTSK